MSPPEKSPPEKSLPNKPDLDWLRKQAKRRLANLRDTNPDAQLSDAQLQLAQEYGFTSWRALKAHVDAQTIDPLLTSALEQAEKASPAVKAAALAHIARVLAVRDRNQAMAVLERSITIAEALREPVRHILIGEAHTSALEFFPERAFALLDELADYPLAQHRVQMTLQRLVQRGLDEAVVGYLLHFPQGIAYPYDVVGSVIHAATDPSRRIALMRVALRVVREEIAAARPHFPNHSFSQLLDLFGDHWGMLPSEEAAATLRELIAVITSVPDERETWGSSSSGPPPFEIHFSSGRQRMLFQLLGPCRRLDPRRAEALVATHPQLARAAARFPDGMESQYTGFNVPDTDGPPSAFRREPDLEEQAQTDYLSLEDAFLPLAEELRTDFDRAFRMALDDYEADTSPRGTNPTPRICWPSSGAFRSILFKAGTYEGARAERHLARIPDEDLRLFAQIELAAALAGVDQAGHSSMRDLPESPQSRQSARRFEVRDDNPPFDVPAPTVIFDKPRATPSYDARIAPTRHPAAAPPAGGADVDFWVIENVPLRPVLAQLFEISPVRIRLPQSLDSLHYDFTLVLPRDETREVLFDRMRSSIERHFGVQREMHESDVRVLTAPDGVHARKRRFEPMAGGGGISGGSFSFSQAQTFSASSPPDFSELFVNSLMDLSAVPSTVRQPPEEERSHAKAQFLRMIGGQGMLGAIQQTLTMSELCVVLESALRQLFIDETGTTAPYDVDVGSALAVTSEEFLRLLCTKLGLVVTPSRRVVEMLTVREP